MAKPCASGPLKPIWLPCASIPWFLGFPWLTLRNFLGYFGIFCLFQGFCGFGSERKSLVNLRFFLGKREKARNGRTGRERKISPKLFRLKFFHGRPRGMSVPKCLFFFQDLEGLTEVFGRMSAGISGQKLPLWAEFSLLRYGCPPPKES